MKDSKYVIGISCIGSGVGQSVITSCRLSNLPLYTVGFGTNAFAFGAYECDTYDYTPTIYAENFVDELIEKCLKHQVDILIPGRDDEALIYAQNQEKFIAAGIKTIVASQKFIEVCRDKELMSEVLNPIQDVFVRCYKKDELYNIIAKGEADFPLIAKPRGGFASNGIEIILSPDDFHRITEEHIIQELAVPVPSDPNYEFYIKQIQKRRNPQVSEISIQVVLGQGGELLGRMASFNKLNNGVPIEVVPYESDLVWEVVDSLMPTFIEMGYVGPLNIQGRLTTKGIKLFEMNPRFTGITGLRALMGFNEVDACIRNWIGEEKRSNLELNSNRFGIRQTTDKSIALDYSDEAREYTTQVNSRKLKGQKTIVISGATGFIGRNLVELLQSDNLLKLVALGRERSKLEILFPEDNIQKYIYDDLETGRFHLGSADVFVHLAFARPHLSNKEIGESLAFTNQLFSSLGRNQIPAIINLSSQSVYGDKEADELWTELIQPAPKTSYGQAKYATELMLRSVQNIFPHLRTTSLRLAAISGGQGGLIPVDFLSKMVQKALTEGKIDIIGGQQVLEVLDIRDACSFIKSFVDTDPRNWHDVYNVGAKQIYSLMEISEVIKKVVLEEMDKSVEINIDGKQIDLNFGMDNTRLLTTLNVKSLYSLPAIVRSLVLFFNKS